MPFSSTLSAPGADYSAPRSLRRGGAQPLAPSKWYLTGFLVPYEAPTSQRADDDGDDTLDEVGRSDPEADDDNAPEQASRPQGVLSVVDGTFGLGFPAETKQLRAEGRVGGLSPYREVR